MVAMKKVDITDVRRALWKLYSESKDWEGKSAEASCEVIYPSFWDCENEESFIHPTGVMVYSYALGPSRQHYFVKDKKDSHPNYYTCNCVDPFATAVMVIKEWGDSYSDLNDDVL